MLSFITTYNTSPHLQLSQSAPPQSAQTSTAVTHSPVISPTLHTWFPLDLNLGLTYSLRQVVCAACLTIQCCFLAWFPIIDSDQWNKGILTFELIKLCQHWVRKQPFPLTETLIMEDFTKTLGKLAQKKLNINKWADRGHLLTCRLVDFLQYQSQVCYRLLKINW